MAGAVGGDADDVRALLRRFLNDGKDAVGDAIARLGGNDAATLGGRDFSRLAIVTAIGQWFAATSVVHPEPEGPDDHAGGDGHPHLDLKGAPMHVDMPDLDGAVGADVPFSDDGGLGPDADEAFGEPDGGDCVGGTATPVDLSDAESDAAAAAAEKLSNAKRAEDISIFYDYQLGCDCVGNAITREIGRLPQSEFEWETIILDGMVIAISEADGEHPVRLDLSWVFNFDVRSDASNSILIVTGSKRDTVIRSLSSLRDSFTSWSLRVKHGNTAYEDLTVSKFALPRHGCYLYWSVPCLYDAFGFKRGDESKAAEKTKHKYINKRWNSWASSVSALGISGFLNGKVSGESEDDDKLAIDSSRVLRFKSVSSVCLIAWMGRMGRANVQSGGLQDSDEREAVKQFLTTLVSHVLFRPGGYKFVFFASDAHLDDFGVLHGQKPFSLVVKPDGAVDFGGLAKLAKTNRKASNLLNAIQYDVLCNSLVVNFNDMMVRLFAYPAKHVAVKSFFMQMAVRVGQAVDEHLLDLAAKSSQGVVAKAGLVMELVEENVDPDHQNYLYTMAAKDVMKSRGCQFLSGAVDKSRVQTFGLETGVFALPDNRAFWAPVQDRGCRGSKPMETDGRRADRDLEVLQGLPPRSLEDVADYVGDLTIAEAISADEFEAAKKKIAERQRAFLKRKRGARGQADWRPPKRHRKSSLQWIGHLDKMLKPFLDHGACHFRQPAELEKRDKAINWPRLSICADQGSDGVCAAGFAAKVLNLNVDMPWDQTHGAHNDIMDGFREAGEYHRMAFVALRLNIPVSPWLENMRWKQVLGCAGELFDKYEHPRELPFFADMEHALMHEPAGVKFLQTDEPPVAFWEHLKTSNAFTNRGTKIMIGRYGDIIRKLRSELPHFEQRKFFYMAACQELDMLHGRAFTKMLCENDANLDDPNADTAAKKDTSAEKKLRKQGCNQMVTGLMEMLSSDCKAKDACMVHAATPWEQWMGKSNAELRSVGAAVPFVTRQLDSEFLGACMETFNVLDTIGSMPECGFTVATEASIANISSDQVVAEEDEIAAMLAHSAIGINFHRLKRMSWMLVGWNSRSARFVRDDAVAKEDLALLRKDFENFERLQTLVGTVRGIKEVVERSSFNDVSVQQVYQVFKESDFEFTDEVMDFFKQANSRILLSQACEDSFNLLKARSTHQNRMASLTSLHNKLVNGNVLHEKHRFRSTGFSQSADIPRGACHQLSDYTIKMKDLPNDFLKVTSFKQEPFWHSPGVERLGVPFGDLPIVEFAVRTGTEDELQFAWLGEVIHLLNDMVVRKKGVHGDADSGWMLAMGSLPNGASIMWPMDLVTVKSPVGDITYFKPAQVKEPRSLYHLVSDLRGWEAQKIHWTCPHVQIMSCGGIANYKAHFKSAGIRPFANGDREDLLVVAARSCFGKMNKTWCSRLASHLGLELPSPCTLMNVLEVLIQHVLDPTPTEMMNILALRLSSLLAKEANTINLFLDVEGSWEYFGKGDGEVFDQVKKHAQQQKFERKEYRETFRKKAKVLRGAAPPAKGGAGRGRGHKGKGKGKEPEKKKLPEGDLVQTDLKPLVPPGGFIWRGSVNGSWHSHFPPFKRFSKSWHLHGHRWSAVLVLRDLWAKYHLIRGETTESCPID
ncbi:unnamed protein product, partial [Prorocentrum cordatum]